LAILLPYIGKPFHIDDPMYLWAAQHIAQHPTDFYGFEVNWGGTLAPMHAYMQNPPLVSYWLALWGIMFGWSEVVMHLALLLPAVGAIIGTYRAGELFTPRPLLAAVFTLVTPVFVVSATTVMCDVLMLCFWVWAIVWWECGLRSNSTARLLLGATLAGLSALSKYYGMCLLPLMAAMTVLRTNRRWSPLLALLVPVLMLAAYQLWTSRLYGTGLLGNAADYATSRQTYSDLGTLKKLSMKALTATCFTGGCLLPVLLLAPRLFNWRWIIAATTLIVLCVSVLMIAGVMHLAPDQPDKPMPWWFAAQLALWAVVGVGVIAIGVAEWWRSRDTASTTLLLWLGGSFAFAALINWSVNGRSILPMAPAAGLLIARWIDRRGATTTITSILDGSRLAIAAIIAMLIARADWLLAHAARTAANKLSDAMLPLPGELWFQSHWGFQEYMQQRGAIAYDWFKPKLVTGEMMVVAMNGSNVDIPNENFAILVSLLDELACTWLSTMHIGDGSGFYSDMWGPLPFMFGPTQPDRYIVIQVNRPWPSADPVTFGQ